jgi:hypothetical protein
MLCLLQVDRVGPAVTFDEGGHLLPQLINCPFALLVASRHCRNVVVDVIDTLRSLRSI